MFVSQDASDTRYTESKGSRFMIYGDYSENMYSHSVLLIT